MCAMFLVVCALLKSSGQVAFKKSSEYHSGSIESTFDESLELVSCFVVFCYALFMVDFTASFNIFLYILGNNVDSLF